MRVEVKVYSILKEVFGSGSVPIGIGGEAVLADLIAQLNIEYGKAFQARTGRSLTRALRDRFNIFVNGNIVKLPEGLSLQLEDKDEVIILQPVGGG